jgi:type II secretory pathway pseudopilin PulG
MENFWLFIVGYIVMVIGLYLFYAYCNFLLSKKLDVKYPWMAFVPGLHLVNLLWLWWKTIKWWLLFYILPVLVVALVPSLSWFMKASGNIWGANIFHVLWLILIPVMYFCWIYATIVIFHGISKRTGHGKWWTVGLILASWLFFPVTAFHYEKWDETTPRPFVGAKKFFLIFFAVIFPALLAIVGIMAAALFPALTSNLWDARDQNRMATLRVVSVAISSYYVDNGTFPTQPSSGCLPYDQIKLYIPGRTLSFVDPIKWRLTKWCDGSDGQSFVYRFIDANSNNPTFIIGAELEGKGRGNSSLTIDQVTPSIVSSARRWEWNYYYISQ